MALADNSDALVHYIEALGGSIVYDTKRFTFELPLAEVKRIIPELNRHQLSCTKVGERQDRDINGRLASIARVEVSRERERTSYDQERGLMAAICRQLDK
jgi:hypothetical protein